MDQLFSIKGERGFITGAARGIGKCLATAFAERGAEVAIIDFDIKEAEITAKEITEKTGSRVEAIFCDVTDEKSVAEAMVSYKSLFGTINFAINNAGIANVIAAESISANDFRKVIDVNVNGVFLTGQGAAKLMIEQGSGGSIINTASMSAHAVNIPQTISNYCASKGAVVMLTKSLAVEWSKYGIRVNCVSPGYIATELVAEMKDMHKGWIEKTPIGRLGTPADLIGAYLYLATKASAYATGTDLIVDGGYTSL